MVGVCETYLRILDISLVSLWLSAYHNSKLLSAFFITFSPLFERLTWYLIAITSVLLPRTILMFWRFSFDGVFRLSRMISANSINANTTNPRLISRYCPKTFNSDADGLSDYKIFQTEIHVVLVKLDMLMHWAIRNIENKLLPLP